MKKSTVISLIKLLSIFIFYHAVLRLEISIFSTFNFFESSNTDIKYKILQLLSGWFPLIINILFGYILWITAEKISNKIITIENDKEKNPNIQHIEATLYSLVGIYLLFNTIPELTKIIYILQNSIISTLPSSENYKRYFASILSLIVRIILSLWLIFGAKWWVNLINTVRNYKQHSKKKKRLILNKN